MSDSTFSSWGLAVLRLVVGIVFVYHGAQKLFIFGFHGVAGMFAMSGVPLPGVSAVVVTLVEFFGGIALIAGIATRLAATLIAIDMVCAILLVHLKNGFSMQHNGYEFPLTLLAANICLMLTGAGNISVEGALRKRS